MVVTLTINPAIDRTITVDRLVFDDRSRILSTKDSAGGRGINAACVIHSFGGEALAIVTSGGKAGTRLDRFLSGCGFRVMTVPIGEQTRTNLTITDSQGLTVNLNESGPRIAAAELSELEKTVQSKLDGASWLLLSGSLPPGVPANFYAKLIAAARRKKVKTLLDTDGDALREGVASCPTVVMPNQQEAERLLSEVLLTRAQFLGAAQKMRAMGAENAVVSLGSRGAVGSFTGGVFEAAAPRVDAVCPIGAGDAMAAAFVWAAVRKHRYEDALRWGVAAGTASAKLPGMTFATLPQTEETYQSTEVSRIEHP